MNTTETHVLEHPHGRYTAFKWVAGGSMMEAVGAIATMALAIIGLAGILSPSMAAIATIVLGASLVIEGGSFGAAQASAAAGTEFEARDTSAAFLGGVAGIVLGILALLGLAQMTLLAVAIIALGASFLLSGFGQGSAFGAGAGGHALVGLGAVVLGILAVVGLSPLVLILAALLALGAGALFSGSAQGTRAVAETSRT
jgi:hypothetical protein